MRMTDSLILREIYDYILWALRQFERKLKYITSAGVCKCATCPTSITTGAIYNVRATHRPSGGPTVPRRTPLNPNDPEARGIRLMQYVSRTPGLLGFRTPWATVSIPF